MNFIKKLHEKESYRKISLETSSGVSITNIEYKMIDEYISLVKEGKEDFIILNSQDGFLQFYGIDDQYVMEMHVNLPENDFRTYSIINPEKKGLMNRVQLTTPFGQYTPTEQDVISFESVKMVTKKYYENIKEYDFLKEVPYRDTTLETKRVMGLIK